MSIRDILKHELIGLNIKVCDAKNKHLIGLEGKIIDETKNTLLIEGKDKRRRLVKSQVVLNIQFKGKMIMVNGKLLVNRPEDRVKRMRKI